MHRAQCAVETMLQNRLVPLQHQFAAQRVCVSRRGLVVTKAAATLEKPPIEPPLPDLPSMDQKIKVGINGECPRLSN